MDLVKGLYTISVEDYLSGEQGSPVKHEYVHGEVFAMAGGSDARNTVTLNIATKLLVQAREKGCRAYSSSVKVRVK